MKTVRAANVSAALRRAGYAVLPSSGRKDRGADGIRVRQSGPDATISIWDPEADELASEIREVLDRTYRISEYPTADVGHALVRVGSREES